MICEQCGCVFCWDQADEALDGQRKRYCSDTCSRKAKPSYKAAKKRQRVRQWMAEKQLAACAERRKQSYGSKREAHDRARWLRRTKGQVLYPYECPCGSWHLTSIAPGSTRWQRRAAKVAVREGMTAS